MKRMIVASQSAQSAEWVATLEDDPEIHGFKYDAGDWHAVVYVKMYQEDLFQADLSINSNVDNGEWHRGELLGGSNKVFRDVPYAAHIVTDWADSEIDQVLSRY